MDKSGLEVHDCGGHAPPVYTEKASSVRCVSCGKFMSYKDLDEGHFHFIPLNEFGPEELEWTHKKCLDKTS